MTYAEKLNVLTGIPVKTLNKIWETTLLFISNEIAQQKNEEVKVINMPPLGTIQIREGSSDLNCQFIPSSNLLKVIEESLNNDQDLLKLKLDKALVSKLEQLCGKII